MATTKKKQPTAKPKPSAAVTDTALEEQFASNASSAQQHSKINSTPIYVCLRCGVKTIDPKNHFFLAGNPDLYTANGGYVPLCKSCMQELYTKAFDVAGDVELAIQICCHYLDWPFNPAIANKAKDARISYPLQEYNNRILHSRDKGKDFGETIVFRIKNEDKDAIAQRAADEKKWDRDSRVNMSYVKKIVGYDPFADDSLTSEDRKYLFNTMAGYCPDDSITEDSHRLQSILNIVSLQLQAHKVGEQINREFAKSPINAQAIDSFTKVQKDLYQSINSMAKENGVSVSSAGASKPVNTLTERMKMLKEQKFEDIEVNMFNIEQSKCFQKIAEISMHAAIKELQLEDNDYSDMLAEQTELVAKLTNERDTLAEELRLLKNQKILNQYELDRYDAQRNQPENDT